MHFGSFNFSFRQHVKMAFVVIHERALERNTPLPLFFRCLLKKPESDKTAEDQ